MFPSLRNRLIISVAVTVGALVWLSVQEQLSGGSGTGGLSLMSARGGVIPAWLLVGIAALPAIALGVVASAAGNPLSGVFVFGAALAVLAVSSGSVEDWRRAMADSKALPAAYRGLLVEVLLWQVLVVMVLVAIRRLRGPVRKNVPRLASDDHLGGDTIMGVPRMDALSSGLVCAVVATILGSMLLQTTDTPQILMGLFIAFTIGGLVGHALFPQTNPVGILLSPAVVCLVVYGFVLFQFDTQTHLLGAWHDQTLPVSQRLPHLAKTLPIHFASTALAGAAFGIGWAQGIVSRGVVASEPHKHPGGRTKDNARPERRMRQA